MIRCTGYRPDPEDVARRRPGLHLLKAKRAIVAPLPLKTFNRSFLAPSRGGPGVLNQFQTLSCEGHAWASAITLRFAILGARIPLVSPIGCYAVPRMMSRNPLADGSLPLLKDEGTEPSLVAAGVSEWGVCSADAWGNYPADPLTINAEPTAMQLEAAQHFELEGAYFMTTAGQPFCRDVMTVLAAGYPCVTAIAASSPTFQNYSGGVLGPLDDDVDHASLWLDYEWNGTDLASLVVWGVNSWGEGWGESDVAELRGGLYRANRDFVDKYAADCAVLDVSATGAEQ